MKSRLNRASIHRRSKRLRRSEEHTSELQSHLNLVCRLLLEKKKNTIDVRRQLNFKHELTMEKITQSALNNHANSNASDAAYEDKSPEPFHHYSNSDSSAEHR